jgi:diguanylate cyclase (GGDEF)-like protein
MPDASLANMLLFPAYYIGLDLASGPFKTGTGVSLWVLPRPFTVLFLDIDRFKVLNDRYGHRAGDEVLKSFARTCLGELRLEDRFGRLGGEEFCAILPETRAFTAIGLANRLRERVASVPVDISGQRLNYTVSIGVAEVDVGDSVETVLGRADEAMYRAKRAGRNRVAVRDSGGDQGLSAGPP